MLDLDFGMPDELRRRRGLVRDGERELVRMPGDGGTEAVSRYERRCSGRGRCGRCGICASSASSMGKREVRGARERAFSEVEERL